MDKTFFFQQSLKIKTKREECSTRNIKEISKTNACNYLENSYQIWLRNNPVEKGDPGFGIWYFWEKKHYIQDWSYQLSRHVVYYSIKQIEKRFVFFSGERLLHLTFSRFP